MLSLELRGQQRRLARQQILSLRQHGFIRPHDLMDGSPDPDQRRRLALAAGLDPTIANHVRDAAKLWKISQRDHFRRIHLRRAARLEVDALISSLYSSKGSQLEHAFQAAMSVLTIPCERLDRPGLQAHPDFLIAIERFPPIVVEVKSKQSDSDLVPLNSATEILSASELIGRGDTFCLTVCSPGIEPSVPGTIEGCARLCVVEICDLAEAILRLKEKTLTSAGLHNWLTTPGIALMEDLPPQS
jgi:helicase